MKDLKSYKIQELSVEECENVNAGWWQYVVGAVAYFLYESAANPQASSDAFSEGWDAAQY